MLQYLIKWKGYPHSDNTWEPASQVHAPELTKAYHCKHLNSRDKNPQNKEKEIIQYLPLPDNGSSSRKKGPLPTLQKGRHPLPRSPSPRWSLLPVAPFPKESFNIYPRSWPIHLHPRCRHPFPFIPHSTPHFCIQTRKNTTPKKTTTHSIGAAPVRLVTVQIPTSSPST